MLFSAIKFQHIAMLKYVSINADPWRLSK